MKNLIKSLFKNKEQNSSDSVKASAVASPVVKVLASEHNKAHFAYIVALACGLLSLFLVFQSISGLNREERVFVIDGSKNMHIGPLETISKNSGSEFLRNFGLIVNQVIFDRTPEGLGLPELAKHIFRKDALEKLNQDAKEHLEEFKAKNIHQKGEVVSIEVLFDQKIPVIKLEGEAIFSGAYEGVPLVHGQRYQLLFKMIKNSNLSETGLYPFIVSDFKIRWQDDA
jgi:hypothetical protein